ncbi:Rpn family recombination-promoting nuclease/putative transposase [cf. Phormidesmis sp. LEGE 11477]|uniref:Rpn family recombination-promoting nuclease/putative transposase n=1 Tax=cf. Phormidesmis sp. LEGE 11477 TaxID=1828680 RepID=UPI0018827303|nr:Rpn family recombination-promoting nuclease/putative transposase [cf. Phormidesmis sp. LEGE 11477]MBE9060737.1 Rpn family recombination-promoting nuclease/putative transposase [cf. Phormidesmis sp. LEGE 11477]
MLTFINPKTDFAFKKIFGSPQSKDILISFLNAILYDSNPTIQDLDILDPYQAPRIEGIKNSFLDIKALLADSRTVIIEMQVLNVLGFEKRVLYNAAKSYSTQLKTGEDYTLLNLVIALTITDFEMFEHLDKVISRYRLIEKDALTEYSDDIELIFVELPKFNKSLDELEDLTDKWLYFLQSADELETVPSSLDQVSAIRDAFEVARQSKLSPEELEIFEKRQQFIHDYRNSFRKAEQLGRERGVAIGEKKARINIARSLLGILPVETISQTTGLSINEIENIEDLED